MLPGFRSLDLDRGLDRVARSDGELEGYEKKRRVEVSWLGCAADVGAGGLERRRRQCR